ncbi:MAG: dUTP diphosphatase [Actinomycetota bacterium]
MSDRLTPVFLRQLELQEGSFGVHPDHLRGEARREYIRVNILAAVAELMEVLEVFDWKPWAPPHGTFGETKHRRALEELVDVWHFVLNLLLVLGVEPEEFVTEYFRKADVNERRQDMRKMKERGCCQPHPGVNAGCCPSTVRALPS